MCGCVCVVECVWLCVCTRLCAYGGVYVYVCPCTHTRICSCSVGGQVGGGTHVGGDPAPALPHHPGPVGGPAPSRLAATWPPMPLAVFNVSQTGSCPLGKPSPGDRPPGSPSGRHKSPWIRKEGASPGQPRLQTSCAAPGAGTRGLPPGQQRGTERASSSPSSHLGPLRPRTAREARRP